MFERPNRPLAQQANRLLHDTYVWMIANDEAVLAPYALTILQYRALELIAQLEQPNLLTLAEMMITSKSTITRIVDYLEQSGWVQRQSDANDRRHFRLSLTDRGKAHLAEVSNAYQNALEARFGVLPPDLQVTLVTALKTLRDHFLTTLEQQRQNTHS